MSVFVYGVLAVLLASSLAAAGSAAPQEKSFLAQKRIVFVDDVWTGARTLTPILTHQDSQYVAYYDSSGQMTVASRRLGSDEWTCKKLDDKILWDSHNYTSIGLDSEGHLHVSGNMHGARLRYYRTTTPGDVTSIVGIHKMVGAQENRVTYPYFFKGAKGELLFMYRDGASGSRNTLVNAYDPRTQTWTRAGGKSLIDGQGLMNAYLCRPKPDPKGVYHVAWVWRDTGDIVTNHDLTYARTAGGDLNEWCRSDGTPLNLPITLSGAEVIDSVPTRAGLRNNVQLTFDAQSRPMVTYVKYYPRNESKTQIYVMRFEDSRWKRYQTTTWDDCDEWSGHGTIGAKIRFAGPMAWSDPKSLYHTFINEFDGHYVQIRFLDSLSEEEAQAWSMNWMSLDLDSWVGFDMETLEKTGSVWVLRWKTLRPNRDQARKDMPPPSRLEVVEFVKRG